MNCNAHCPTCGRHFSGTTAFDRHREGPWDARHCADPRTVEDQDGDHRLFEHRGDCGLTGIEFTDIPVWSTKRDD